MDAQRVNSLYCTAKNSIPIPFFGTTKAYFVCDISPIFQTSLIYAFIGCPLGWPALWRITMNSLHNQGIYK